MQKKCPPKTILRQKCGIQTQSLFLYILDRAMVVFLGSISDQSLCATCAFGILPNLCGYKAVLSLPIGCVSSEHS